jgi:hypothetical protein
LGKIIVSITESIKNNLPIQIKINNFINFYTLPTKFKEKTKKIIKPYNSCVIIKNRKKIIFPDDGSTEILKIIDLLSPFKSLQEISSEENINLNIVYFIF